MNSTVQFKSKEFEAKAFRWELGVETPDWFQLAYTTGKAFVVIDNAKESYIYVENKRGKYKGFVGDWIVMDEFGHLHIVSEATFDKRYELANV